MGVEVDVDGFGMGGAAGGDLFVGGAGFGAVGVAGEDFADAVEFFEGAFHAPEAAAGEGGDFFAGLGGGG